MIKQFTDHAANERTYLAWVRTAIAVIAFGFVLERFDILLHTIVKTLGENAVGDLAHGGRTAGITMVAVGVATLAAATYRFALNTRRISSEQNMEYSPRSVLWVGGLFLALGLVVLFYVSRLLWTDA